VYLPEETSSEGLNKPFETLTATETTAVSGSNKRATSRPRVQGFETRSEQASALENMELEQSTGQSSTHRESRNRAVKKEKPFGVIFYFINFPSLLSVCPHILYLFIYKRLANSNFFLVY